MTPSQNFTGIADDSKPNAGRIYDYIIGGDHNFEVDRQQAAKVIALFPELPKLLRLLRWYLGTAVRILIDEGYRQFIDFASGLPTQDHIHQIAPQGTKVIYSDIDPVTVEFGKKLLKDNKNTMYLKCDAAKPEEILTKDIVDDFFDKNEKIAVGLTGIGNFLSNEAVEHSLKVLYDWSWENTKLYYLDNDLVKLNESTQKILEMYEQMGQPFHLRKQEELQTLIGKWKPVEPGYIHLADWINRDGIINPMPIKDAILEQWGGKPYGVIFKK